MYSFVFTWAMRIKIVIGINFNPEGSTVLAKFLQRMTLIQVVFLEQHIKD